MFSFIRNILAKRKMAQRGMLNTSRKVNRKESLYRRLMNSRPAAWTVMALLVLAASVFSMMHQLYRPLPPDLKGDQPAFSTIYVQNDFDYEDRDKTKQLRDSAAAKVPLYCRLDNSKIQQISGELDKLLQEIRSRGTALKTKQPHIASDTSEGKRIAALPEAELNRLYLIAATPQLTLSLQKQLNIAASNGIIPAAERNNGQGPKYLRIIDGYGRIHDPLLRKDIPTVAEAASVISGNALETFNSADKAETLNALSDLLKPLLEQVEIHEDKTFTEKEKEKAMADVKPVIRKIFRGYIIVKSGEQLTEENKKILAEYREISRIQRDNIRQDAGKLIDHAGKSLLTTLFILLFCGIYLHHINPDILQSAERVRMIGFVVVLSILLNVLTYRMFLVFGEIESIPPWLICIVLPLGFAPMILSCIYGMRTALFAGLFVSVIAAFSVYGSFHIVLMGLMISAIASYAVRRCVNYRNYFIYGFLSVSLTSLAIALLFIWRDIPVPGREFFPWSILLPFTTGLLTAGLTQVTLYILEVCCDTPTNMSLLLYSDYNHPLLKRLQFEAPGTYHHSLVVSMLAEAAAKEIGANPIKARVCALFHDVGKLAQPEYFSENDNGENKHRELMPKISALIIRNHVKEGLELARKYKLKKLMRDAIQQHHGTDLVRFFYKQAQDSGENVDEHDYRYEGPTPQTKEIAILSLADACEAASRSLQKPAHNNIEELVNEIIFSRMLGHQLDAANLTFKELTTIKESFVNTLTAMLHARVAYPKEATPDENDLFVDAAARKAAEQKDS